MTAPDLSALVISTRPDWMGAARLPGVLLRHGLRVGAVCPEGALLTLVRGLTRCATFRRGTPVEAFWEGLTAEIEGNLPDLLLPTDDDTLYLLHDLHAQLGDGARDERLRTLLERSLGDPGRYPAIERKSALVEMGAQTGVPIPESRVLDGLEAALDFAGSVGYPLVLKPDFGVGGAGVTRCDTPEALAEAYQTLSARPARLGRAGSARITAQRLVRGPTASVTLAAWQGELLAGFAWLREHPFPDPFGLASVVQLVPSPVMLERARQVVAHFGFSGLGSVQFVLDGETNEPLVMEINARATPVGNLGEVFGTDLVGALLARLRGQAAPASRPPSFERVALFPNEWRRDPHSAELRDPKVLHDVPWEEPALLAALLAPAEGAGWDARHPALL